MSRYRGGRKPTPVAARKLARRLHKRGLSLRDISRELAEQGFVLQQGKHVGQPYLPQSIKLMLSGLLVSRPSGRAPGVPNRASAAREAPSHPLRVWRLQHALTLEALAQRLGIAGATLSRIETGDARTSATVLGRIMKVTRGKVDAEAMIAWMPPMSGAIDV